MTSRKAVRQTQSTTARDGTHLKNPLRCFRIPNFEIRESRMDRIRKICGLEADEELEIEETVSMLLINGGGAGDREFIARTRPGSGVLHLRRLRTQQTADPPVSQRRSNIARSQLFRDAIAARQSLSGLGLSDS